MKEVFDRIMQALGSKKHLMIGISAALLLAFLPIVVASLVLKESLLHQIYEFSTTNAVMVFLVAIFFGILISMQTYAASLKGTSKTAMAGQSAGTGLIAMIGAMFSGAACAACLSTIFGAIGLGGAALSIFSYRTEILVISLILLTISIYFTGKKIASKCKVCRI